MPAKICCAIGPITGIGFSCPFIADIKPMIHKTSRAIPNIQMRKEINGMIKSKIMKTI